MLMVGACQQAGKQADRSLELRTYLLIHKQEAEGALSIEENCKTLSLPSVTSIPTRPHILVLSE